MAAPKKDHQYTTMSPVTPKGKWFVCSRRIGSRDSLAPIAEVRAESIAAKIVDGLNLLQGEEVKLTVPAERLLNDVRESLRKEQALVGQLRSDVRNRDETIRRMGIDADTLRREKMTLQVRIDNLMKAVPNTKESA